MKNIEKNLEEYGLSKNEAKIYIECLILGTTTVYNLSNSTKLPKSTCYDTLHSLEKKGLVFCIIKSKKKNYEATDPAKLIFLLDEKKEKMKSSVNKLQKLKNASSKKPKIQMYQGKTGMKTILEEIINLEEIKVFGNFNKFKEYFQFYSSLFVDKRVKKNIFCRLIEEKSKENINLSKKDKKELRKTKFLKSLRNVSTELFISEDKTAIFKLHENEPLGILIEDKEISNLFKIMFEEIWKN